MKVSINKLENYSDQSGNTISVGKGSSSSKMSVVFNDKGSSIIVGDNVTLDLCTIELGRNSKLVIGNNSKVRGFISVGLGSSISIGADVDVVSSIKLRAVELTSLTIGDDCLFANNVTIRTNDGHPIYDARTRERLNPSKSVVIGDHVWVGEDVVILKGVEIGVASIIAGRSVVTKNIPKNCVAAGSPAKIVREGVTWEHNPNTFSPQYYEELHSEVAAESPSESPSELPTHIL